jgi:hypothetical protein
MNASSSSSSGRWLTVPTNDMSGIGCGPAPLSNSRSTMPPWNAVSTGFGARVVSSQK